MLNSKEIIKKKLGERLLYIRKDVEQIPARQFAESIAADASYYTKAEKGGGLSDEYLDRIIARYGYNKAWLYFGDGEPKSGAFVPRENALKELVKKIQYINDWSIEDVAKSIHYSRVHLNREMLKPVDDKNTEEIIQVLKEKHKDILPKESYQDKRRLQKNNSDRKRTIPFFDAEATASNVNEDMTPISAPAGTIDVGDLLHDSEAAIRIYGNSMLPNYPPGCVVGLVQTTKEFIQPGEVYVIETEDQRLLKRLFYKEDDPESQVISCYSDNVMKFDGGSRAGKVAYPPFNLKKDGIKKLFIVTGVIKRNVNSIIINRN